MPPEQRASYTERLLLLPRCYQLNDHLQLYTHVLEPHAAGVPPPLSWPTIANFNQLMKVAPDIFGVWAGAMRRAPRTRLMLLTGVTNARVPYGATTRHLRAELRGGGVRPSRLVGGQAIPKTEHLLRARGCALAVDTLSYNSHTTGADALWAGLPIVTLSGRYLASRVGASLGVTVGVPQARVASLKAYEDAVAALIAPPDGAAPSLLNAPADPAALLRPADTFGTFSLFGHDGGGGGGLPWEGSGAQSGHSVRMPSPSPPPARGSSWRERVRKKAGAG